VALPDAAMVINPATGRLAGLEMPAVPVAPTQAHQDAAAQKAKMDGAMGRDPGTGKLQGLEQAPYVAQAQADQLLDELHAPPESPSGYRDAPLPPEMGFTPADSKEFREVAHEIGLGIGQYQHVQVAMAVAARAANSGMSLAKYTEQTTTKLRATWGDQFEPKMAAALGVARELRAKHPWAQALFNSHAGSDPTIIRVLAEVAERRARQQK
jgi:hypothetical protein